MEHMAIIEDYLKEPQVAGEALNIVLSISNDPESQSLLLENKNIIKELISFFDDGKHINVVLQILINLTQSEQISELCISNNIFEILFNYLKNNIRPDQKDEKSNVNFQATENAYVIGKDTVSTVPLVLMLMNNLTTYRVGRNKFMNASSNPTLKFYMLENLIAMTDYFKDSEIFDFGANVISNCCSGEHENYKPFLQILPMMSSIKKSKAKRMKITEGVKNLLMSYSEHIEEIKEADFLTHIGKSLIEVNKEQLSEVRDEEVKM